MSLDDLKVTWKLVKLNNSFDTISLDEVQRIIASTEDFAVYNTRRLFSSLAIFLLFLICCQGG